MVDQLRQKTESAFGGADLSAVATHAGGGSSSSLGATAFTGGSDLHFAPGSSSSSAGGGNHLAHEAAHVVQQGAGKASPSPYAGMF